MASSDRIRDALARNVRALRRGREWSLADLASRSGISRAMIVHVEAGRTNASLSTMCQIADALGVPVTELIDAGSGPAARVIAPEETTVVWADEQGSRARLMAGLAQPDSLEVWEWRLERGASYEANAHPPGTREIVWVHSGTLEIRVGARALTIESGGGAVFEAREAHSYRNAGAFPVEFAMVVSLA
jgi:transcriptional regulator with XRE-family HTH domain